MLLRNMNVAHGLLNCTQKMYENALDLEIVTDVEAGRRVLLPRVDLSPADSTMTFPHQLK